MSQRQSLIGVCFMGVCRLNYPIDEDVYYAWLKATVEIQTRNQMLNRQCIALQERFIADGFTVSVLKGQGLAILYNKLQKSEQDYDLSSLRQPGDIDVWVAEGMDKVLRKYQVSRFDYKHATLCLEEDVKVEIHWRPEILLNLYYNYKLQQYWKSHSRDFSSVSIRLDGRSDVHVPSSSMNMFYILLHIYRHMFSGGVGLRQVMDYYIVIITCYLEDQERFQTYAQDVMATVCKLKMAKFTGALMWILAQVFYGEQSSESSDWKERFPWMLCHPDEKEGAFLLTEILKCGNFGQHDSRINVNGVGGKLSVLLHNLQHGSFLMSHYPIEVLSMPVWYIWHWFWKRGRILSSSYSK